jgi:AAA ATPase domain
VLSGGIADKVGNRYESLWLVDQLLDLFDGKALAVTNERLGKENDGFEFDVERTGFSEWVQSKRQTSRSWTINELAQQGVLNSFQAKLKSGSTKRCRFVSTDAVKSLKLLKEKRHIFADHQQFVTSFSETETKDWGLLLTRLDCSPEETFDWLARCDFVQFPEDQLQKVVIDRLDRWVVGDPALVFAKLKDWLGEDEQFNRRIDRDSLIDALKQGGFELKQHELNNAIPGKISHATERYDASYGPVGAGLFEISRDEQIKQLVDAIDDADGPKIIFVAGPAGVGKSTILRKAHYQLAENRRLLAFRADQLGDLTSLPQLGQATIQLEDSPAVVLEQLSGQSQSILLIDQTDAVSEVSGRFGSLRRLILELVDQASRYPHVRVIFSCRSFDLDSDHKFTEFAKRENSLRIDVPAFRWTEDVLPVLANLGIQCDEANPRVRALLCNPIALKLAAELANSGEGDLRQVLHLSQLYDSLILLKEREIRQKGNPPWALLAVLEAIARDMNDKQSLGVSTRLLNPFAGAADFLQQSGLVVIRGQRLSLMHESLFDYLHARAFVEDGQKLLTFLRTEEQTLFRRTQVRQILALERDTNRTQYLADLHELLLGAGIRPHIRNLVSKWLASVADPSMEEWKIISAFADASGDIRKAGLPISGQVAWLALLNENGILNDWFKMEDADLSWAMWQVRNVAAKAPGLAAGLFHQFLDARPEKAGLVLKEFFYFDPEGPCSEIAELMIRAIRMNRGMAGEDEQDRLFGWLHGWSTKASDDACAIAKAVFEAWYAQNGDGDPFGEHLDKGMNDLHNLAELKKTNPVGFLEVLLPAMHTAMIRSEKGDELPLLDSIWASRRLDRTDVHSPDTFDFVRSALAEVAKNQPDEARRLLTLINPQRHETALHLLLESVAANGAALADLLADYADNPGLFRAGWSGAPALSAGKALAAAWPALPEDVRSALEKRVLDLWPELSMASQAWKTSKQGGTTGWVSPAQYRSWALADLRYSGRRQWSILRMLNPDLLTNTARDRLKMLNRKFCTKDVEEPNGITGGQVVSPIASNRCARMSDKAWLSAMQEYSERPGDREWSGSRLLGGARELSQELQGLAKEQPERFMTMLASLPAGLHDCFASSIVRGLSETKPTPEIAERILEIVDINPNAKPDVSSLVWLAHTIDGEPATRATALLRETASAPENASGMGETQDNKERKEPLFKVAQTYGNGLTGRFINAPRGSALEQLGNITWRSKESFEANKDIVDTVLRERAPDYIVASLGVFLQSALKHDASIAKNWLLQIVENCPEALLTTHGFRALKWLDELDHATAKVLIGQLIQSENPLVRAWTSHLLFICNLHEPDWGDLASYLFDQGEEERAAAADVAAMAVRDKVQVADSVKLLERLIVDESPLVRTEASDVFRLADASRLADTLPIYRAHVGSQSFDGERTYFIHRLEHAPANMAIEVLELIEGAVARMSEPGSKRNSGAYQITEPIMALYATNDNNSDIRRRCLDAIDKLIESELWWGDDLEGAA